MDRAILVFVGFAAIVVVVAVLAIMSAARRRKELMAWAYAHGLSFDRSNDKGMRERFPSFGCLQTGHDRYAYDVMRGEWRGLGLTAFDYHYSEGSGKDEHDYSFSAVVVDGPFPLKGLSIRHETFLDRIGAFFGHEDINFESAEFSRKFYVKAADRKWAYDVIHARMMEYLLAGPDVSIQFDEGHIIVWSNKCYRAVEFEAAADFVCGMVERIPDYVVKQQRGE